MFVISLLSHRSPVVFASLLAAFLVLAGGSPATAQVVQIGDVEEVRVGTPHPYPAGTPGGRVVWEHTFHFPRASYVKVHFGRFELAPGDEIVLADPAGRYRHVYRGRGWKDRGGDFWALSVLGDTLVVRLVSRNPAHQAFGAEIDRVAHGYPLEETPPEPEALCGAEDFRDVECYKDEYPTAYEKARAVVRLIKNGAAHCTGWIADCENHVVTNEHCVADQAELDDIEFQFDYKRPSCGSGTPTVGLQLQGGVLLEVNADLDYAYILPDLAGNDPQATYGFLQWENVRKPDIDEQMYIPGHPSGDPKRLSIESTDPHDESGLCEVYSLTEPPCAGGDADIGYYCDTEGGSSGSPVLSYVTHRVIALHHCARCPNRGVPITDVYADLEASGHPLPGCAICDAGPAPANLQSSVPGDNVIRLTWDAVPDATAYRVYRSREGCDGTFERVADDVAGTTWDDTNVSGGRSYSYYVTALNDCRAESEPSNCVTETATGGCIDPPLFDGLLSATNAKSSLCAIELHWDPATPQCGTAVRYNVYRSLVPGFTPGPGNMVASCVTGTSYRDTGIDQRIEYFYVVRAEDDSGDGSGPCGNGNEETNTVERSSMATGPDEVFASWTFEQDEGWTLEGEWEIDSPRGLGGSANGGSGGPDPDAAFEGSRVLGVDLTGQGSYEGNYEDNVSPAWYATSPAFDASGASEVLVRYRRWLGVERNRYDKATLEVFDGNGWQVAWENPDTRVTDDSWQLEEVDLTDLLAGVPNARIRFGLGSDSSVRYCGWNVDVVDVYRHQECTEALPGIAPVPDGWLAGGTPMTAEKPGTGATAGEVVVHWDVTTCPGPAYHLLAADSDRLADYGYESGACALDPSGTATVPITDPQPGHFTWWVIVEADGTTEGHHGFRSDGTIRPASGVGLCGILDHDDTGTCP